MTTIDTPTLDTPTRSEIRDMVLGIERDPEPEYEIAATVRMFGVVFLNDDGRPMKWGPPIRTNEPDKVREAFRKDGQEVAFVPMVLLLPNIRVRDSLSRIALEADAASIVQSLGMVGVDEPEQGHESFCVDDADDWRNDEIDERPDPEEESKENPVGYDLRVIADDYDEMADDVVVVRESLTDDVHRITSLLHRQEEATRQMANVLRSMIDSHSVAGLHSVYAINESLLSVSCVIGDLMRDGEVSAVASRLHHHLHMKICFDMRSSLNEAIHDAGGEVTRQSR